MIIAGDVGIEPTLTVLETVVIPFHQSPVGSRILLFCLFVDRLLAAPFAKLLELDFALNFLFIFGAPIIDALAGRALELNKAVLGHKYSAVGAMKRL